MERKELLTNAIFFIKEFLKDCGRTRPMIGILSNEKRLDDWDEYEILGKNYGWSESDINELVNQIKNKEKLVIGVVSKDRWGADDVGQDDLIVDLKNQTFDWAEFKN